MENKVLKIHRAGPTKLVLAITGGGTAAIGELLKYGEGSATLLEAVVPYDNKSFCEFIGGKPDKYCSVDSAMDLAFAACQRARKLTGNDDVIGVGCTASLAKLNEREGREHKAYIGVQTPYFSMCRQAIFNSGDRIEQESTLSEAIIEVLRIYKGKEVLWPQKSKILENEGCGPYRDIAMGKFQACDIRGKEVTYVKDEIIFSGAFNPIHEQHINMMNLVSTKYNKKVRREICITNIDKVPLNYLKIRNAVGEANEIYLTRLPLFSDKIRVFDNCQFIIGWDTLTRLNNPKYGNLDILADSLDKAKARFIVFHRVIDGKDSRDGGDTIYPRLLSLCDIVDVPSVEMSSSSIRKNNEADIQQS